MKNLNILICGVGGQGTLLASRVLGAYAVKKQLDCKLSEVHGMAQRGGSVVTYVKMGEKIYSPLIADGDADVVLAFEELEASRFAFTASANAKVIVNTRKIMPLPVITGAVKYPENLIQELSKKYNIVPFDALEIALKVGNAKTVNTVMIAKLTKELGLDSDAMLSALIECVPEKAREINEKAFLAVIKE